VKADVRRRAAIDAGDTVDVELDVLVWPRPTL
jgi:hypothetical protein